MTVFGNAKRLAAWAGVCPGNYESAGKKKSTAARKGNIHLKTVQACAARTKGSYDKDKYHRLKARRGSLRPPSRTRSWSPCSTCSPKPFPLRTHAKITA